MWNFCRGVLCTPAGERSSPLHRRCSLSGSMSMVGVRFLYNEHKYLVYLSAQFMELSEYDKGVLVIDMLDNIDKH